MWQKVKEVRFQSVFIRVAAMRKEYCGSKNPSCSMHFSLKHFFVESFYDSCTPKQMYMITTIYDLVYPSQWNNTSYAFLISLLDSKFKGNYLG